MALDSCWLKHQTCQRSDGYQHRGHIIYNSGTQQYVNTSSKSAKVENVTQANLQGSVTHKSI